MDVGLVCDACSALTPFGTARCVRCQAPVTLDGPAVEERAASAPVAPNGARTCPECKGNVAGELRFCPNCGMKMPDPKASPWVNEETQMIRPMAGSSGAGMPKVPERSTMLFGAMQAARAKLTLIRGDGEDGTSFTLAGEEHSTGRANCAITFDDDPFLSPAHANFFYRGRELVVRDESSLNGVYVRVDGSIVMPFGSTVLIGEQVLTVAAPRQPPEGADPDGTYYSATLARPAAVEIIQHLRGGGEGWVFRVPGTTISIGRESNDINFPDDPYISGKHAELRITDRGVTLTDAQSRNGTFIRVVGEHVLAHGDYVFMGQQLLRVEIV